MWTCFRLSSNTVWHIPSCCPPLPDSSGDRSRSLRRWVGALWWAAPPASAPTPTPRSAAGRRPVCRPGRPPWSSASVWARRSRPICSRASLSPPCTHADLHPHRESHVVVMTTRSDTFHWFNAGGNRWIIWWHNWEWSRWLISSVQFCFVLIFDVVFTLIWHLLCNSHILHITSLFWVRKQSFSQVWCILSPQDLSISLTGSLLCISQNRKNCCQKFCLPLASNIFASVSKTSSRKLWQHSRRNPKTEPHLNQDFLLFSCGVFLCARLTCNEACGRRCMKTQTEEAKEERAQIHGLCLHSTLGTSGAEWWRPTLGGEKNWRGHQDTTLLLDLLTESLWDRRRSNERRRRRRKKGLPA